MEGSVMALKEHFCNTGSAAEVSVDLERRMSVEEIRICTALAPEACASCRSELIGNELVCSVSVEKTSPKAYLPSHRPSCCWVTTVIQRVAGCRKELRSSPRRNLVAREKAVKMRYMAMVVIRIVPVMHPLLKLSMLSDLHRSHLFHSCCKLLRE